MFIELSKLTKVYGNVTALQSCDLEIERGEIFGLLGPNGAGKTTLLRLLLGFLKPTSGAARVAGLDCYIDSIRTREITSYLPGDVRLFRRMTGREYLRFICSLRPGSSMARVTQLANEIELQLDRRIAYMSTGMRQKVALAAVLASNAKLIILDEPTSNLDPNIRAMVTAKILELSAGGTTVLFSSHVLPEVEESCGRVAIMKEGQVAVVQEMSILRAHHRITARIDRRSFRVSACLSDQVTVLSQSETETVLETSAPLTALFGWLSSLPLTEIEMTRTGLQAVYDQIHPRESQLGGGDRLITNSAGTQ